MVRAIVITVMLGTCGWTAAAGAQPRPTADQLIDQGLALRGRGRDAEALALFERAYAQTPTPRAQAQIALAEGALARWLAADRHLRAAIAASSDAWIAGHRQILQDALRTIDANLGGVRVTGTATGAAVRIAGSDAGTVPMAEPVMVEPGVVTIEIARPGVAVETVEVRVAAGARVQHVADAAGPVGDTSPTPLDPDPAPVDPGPEPAGGSSTLTTLGAVGLGVAGAGLITGVIAHVLREGYAADFNADPACGTGIDLPTANCESIQASFDRAGTIAVVGYVTAGVFAAVSVVLLLAGGGGEDPAAAEQQGAIGCGLTPTGLGCSF